MNLLEVAWGGPLLDGGGFGGIHGDSVGGDYESEVFGGVGVELTLFGFDVEVILSEPIEDESDMLFVFGGI